MSGYVGRNPDRRGRSALAAGAAVVPARAAADLLDEWLIACWQNRPHDGLRDPGHPGRAFTPNEKYAALAEAAGYLPVPLDSGDYIELLPATWRAVNAYGIKIRNRTYDSEELNPVRMQKSGISQRKGLWEIHYDPYDVSRVFVRGPDGVGHGVLEAPEPGPGAVRRPGLGSCTPHCPRPGGRLAPWPRS